MPFRDFHDTYLKRKRFFKTNFNPALLKKTYIKLRRGSEIRFKDFKDFQQKQNRSVSDILIDIPQIRMVKQSIRTAYDNVEISQEHDIRIIYGDYGHGKSQTANIIVEDMRDSDKSNLIVYIENISTIQKFYFNLGNYIKEFLSTYHRHTIANFDYYLESFKQTRFEDQINQTKLISDFIEFVQKLTEKGITLILLLDEIDKIIQDEIERQKWINFLVSINDASNLSLLLVLFMPQKTSNDLVSLDKRMERWNNFFTIRSDILDGNYGNAIEDAVANILALSVQYHQVVLDHDDLEFIFAAFEYKHEYLEASSIRKVNTWMISLCELFVELKKYNLWKHYNEVKSLSRTDQGYRLERNLKNLLLADRLPYFEQKREDSDDTELFRSEYSETNLSVGNYRSDGHFNQYVNYMNDEMLKHTIAVEMKYTEQGTHQGAEIEKIEKLADSYPTIFFSLGSSQSTFEEMSNHFESIYQDNLRKYPIFVIRIPEMLLAPLVLFPDSRRDSGFNQKKKLIINWSNIITSHREQLEFFLRELPSEIIRRKMMLRSYELAGLPVGSNNSQSDQEPQNSNAETNKLVQGKIFLASSIITMLDDVASHKYLSTIERESRKLVKSQYPRYTHEITNELQNLIQKLHDSGMTQRGGGKNITVKKTDTWQREKAMSHLKSYIEHNNSR